jgi:hypothetical protein
VTVHGAERNGTALDYLLKHKMTAVGVFLGENSVFPDTTELSAIQTENYATFVKLCRSVAWNVVLALVSHTDQLCDKPLPCKDATAFSQAVLTFNVTNSAIGPSLALDLDIVVDFSMDVEDYILTLA